MVKITLDLFKLDSKEDTANSWIWIKFTPITLKKEYLNLLKTNSQNKIGYKISKKLNVGYSTIVKHLIKLKKSKEKIWLPLPLIIQLTKLTNKKIKENIIKSIEYLGQKNNNSHDIKAIKEIKIELAKIIGAHIADGYLQKEGSTYKIKICDERKDAIEKVSKWIKEVFGINSRIKYYKDDNICVCWFNNKIIGRYFKNIFGIKSGKKFDIAREPKIIKNSPIEIRNSFALGVLTFDGGIKSSGTIAFSSMSKKLIDDIFNILKVNEIKTNKTYNIKKGSWLLESISGRNKIYLKKWQTYFEKGTWKYKRLQFFLNNKKHSMKDLRYLFPEHYRSKIGIFDVYKSIEDIKSGKLLDVQKNLKMNNIEVSNITLYKYLHILNKSGLIYKTTEKISDNKNYWSETIYNLK